MLPTMIHERVDSARNGTNETVISRVHSGWAVVGDRQFLPGYCLLLPDPVVTSLNDLSVDRRTRFLLDMSLLGDAVLEATDAVRINYSILGNASPALHAHVFARYEDEDPNYKCLPVWRYPLALRQSVPFSLDGHGDLLLALRVGLERRGMCTSG
jgi:diadenosine tetraphosphate (Ap4A) HIT family hydrolase